MSFFSKKIRLSSFSFELLFVLITFLLYNAHNLSKYAIPFAQEDGFEYSFYFSGLGIMLLIYYVFFLLLNHAYVGKIFASIFIICSGILTYFQIKYEVVFNKTIFESLLKTDAQEVSQFLSFAMIGYFLVYILLPLSVLWFKIKIDYKKPAKHFKQKLYCFLATIVIALLILLPQVPRVVHFSDNNQYYSQHLLIPNNYLFALYNSSGKLFEKKIPTKIIPVTPLSKDQDLLVVLMIGEAARKANFSLYGYEKNTNPLLGKRKDLQVLPALAAGPATAIALKALFFHQDYESFLSTLQRQGVSTSWTSNSGYCEGACDQIPVYTTDECLEDCDGKSLELLLQNLSAAPKGQQLAVYRFVKGSHGSEYYKNYPKAFEQFQPICAKTDIAACSYEELVNTYDNTIVYTDFLIHKTIEFLAAQKRPAVLVYVSDHGESLGEDGVYFHGFGLSIPPQQLEIPLLVWSNVPHVAINPQSTYLQNDLIHSMFTLFGMDSPIYDAKASWFKKM